jgi:hypothetical protein
LSDLGISIRNVDENGLVQSMAYGSGDRAQGPNKQRIEEQCHEEFYSLVEAGWFSVVNAEDSEEAYLARVSTCLRGRGYDVPPSPPTFEVLLDGISLSAEPDIRACAQESLDP